jgi:hypothetical protein
MRSLADAERIQRFITELGREARSAGRAYLTGGASAVLMGWRDSTIDVDLKLVPDSDELLRAIPSLKERLKVNVELASPPDFIPVPPGWEDRGVFIRQAGPLSFFHFDPYAQALAKLERGHRQDLADVEAMLSHGLIDRVKTLAYFDRIQPELYRFPAIDPPTFRRAVEQALTTD